MLKVSCTSYLNAAPFVYGLQAEEFGGRIQLRLEPPAKCAVSFFAGKADVALIPVGTLMQNNEYKIITDYCIGASGSVYSVCLFANEPVNMLKNIYLDRESRTSVKLLQILTKEYWFINPVFSYFRLPSNSNYCLPKYTGCLLIGDKTFSQHRRFTHIYDLAEVWQTYTGLPFAFAVWVARNGIAENDVEMLNKALSLGVCSIEKIIKQWQTHPSDIDVAKYFTENIDYTFDEKKRQAIHLFLTKINNL